jgi:hypothetical protein
MDITTSYTAFWQDFYTRRRCPQNIRRKDEYATGDSADVIKGN